MICLLQLTFHQLVLKVVSPGKLNKYIKLTITTPVP